MLGVGILPVEVDASPPAVRLELDVLDPAAAGLDDRSDALLGFRGRRVAAMQFCSFGLVPVETRAQDQGMPNPLVRACRYIFCDGGLDFNRPPPD